MRRLVPVVLSLLVLAPAVALADAAAATAPAPWWSELLVQYVVPALGALVCTVLAALGALLAQWVRAKTGNEQLAAGLERGFGLAKDAIAYVDANTKATQKEISADGVITPEEAKRLQDEALGVLKAWLGTSGLAEMSRLSGVAIEHIDSWLRAQLQRAFALKPEKTLWVPPADPPTTTTVVAVP